jgi:hypothetical protein
MDDRSLLRLNTAPRVGLQSSVMNPPHVADAVALEETIAWCSLQPVTAVSPETADTLRRRVLLRRAGELSQELRKRQPEGWYKSPDYERVMELYKSVDIGSLSLLSHQLRSVPLMPPQEMWEDFSDQSIKAAVAHVVSSRSQCLRDRHDNFDKGSEANPSGKLLHYFPHENLACGAANYASNGFFDDNNVPAWDTWVEYADRTLVSWVPVILVPLVQEGIDANPEQCIQWASR